MNNYERIKNMSIDEMAEFLYELHTGWVYNQDGIKRWLVEQNPKFEINPYIKTESEGE